MFLSEMRKGLFSQQLPILLFVGLYFFLSFPLVSVPGAAGFGLDYHNTNRIAELLKLLPSTAGSKIFTS